MRALNLSGRTRYSKPAYQIKQLYSRLFVDGNADHQAVEDISLMRGIPNMAVFAPADELDLTMMLPQFGRTQSILCAH